MFYNTNRRVAAAAADGATPTSPLPHSWGISASLFVVTQRGEFYSYGLTGEGGGGCVLMDERRLLSSAMGGASPTLS